ncbi:MAG: hypothetical protein LPJ91_02330 [Pseudazoarcus pumilus]|nr:hypothetical protein [Pseudazoarcus pumilus]
MNPTPITAVPALVKELYGIVAEFERLFPGRRFTPDGHLVGSIGEVVAAHRYGLSLFPGSTEVHDACAPNGVSVQVKATQGKSVALRAEPEHLLVLFLASDGEVTEVFNGPGSVAWSACGPMQKNGQRPIGLSRLQKLMAAVPESARLAVARG